MEGGGLRKQELLWGDWFRRKRDKGGAGFVKEGKYLDRGRVSGTSKKGKGIRPWFLVREERLRQMKEREWGSAKSKKAPGITGLHARKNMGLGEGG